MQAHLFNYFKCEVVKCINIINNISRELITPKSQGGSAAQESFEVAKTGDARIGFVGFPSVGES